MFSFLAGCLCLSLVLQVALCDGLSQQRNKKKLFSPIASSFKRKPNIVLILTDDQDVELGSLNFMPKTLKSIRDKGAQFRHAYVTTPMCCPSRSSLLTGMYVHNHQVYTNNDNCSSTQWQASHETRTFATYLSNAGYRTGYFGKYLNKYNGSYIPPGWREWGGLIMNSKYYNYSINMNGKKIKHGFDYHKDYYPDLIANDSIAFLRQSKTNKQTSEKPVMLTMSFPAPHGPEDSAPQYSHLFFNVTTHHTPSYDYAPNPDKQWILQVTQKMQPIHRQFTDLLMTKRLQTLQSVDAAVQRVVEELRDLGELENTYIIYTSDHGYHLGQFGLIKGKSFPFEFDVRVPFLVRGPGVEPGTVVDDIVLNIDLAPTFLDIAGVDAPSHMDGRSVLPLFLNSKRKRNGRKWPDTFLIESSGRRETPYLDAKNKAIKYSTAANVKNFTTESPTTYNYFFNTTVGTFSSTLVGTVVVDTTTLAPEMPKVYESGEELTINSPEMEDEDLEEDAELEELEEEELDSEDDTNKDLITGSDIQLDNRLLPEVLPRKMERLQMECAQEQLQPPCKRGQKWYCSNENGRWRKHKCKIYNTNEKSFRTCACFTEVGLVYKKIPANLTPKYDVKLSKRVKRDTLAHVENAMADVKDKIYGLNTSLPEEPLVKVNLETNAISENKPRCVIMNKNIVNCSTVIYHDRKTWRRSRHNIDIEIQQLKQKLETLKSIRKHLRQSKPTDGEEDSEEIDRNSTSKIDLPYFNELNIHHDAKIDIPEPIETIHSVIVHRQHNNGSKLIKKKRKRPLDSEDNNARPAKRPRLRLDNETPISSTEAPNAVNEISTNYPFESSNPHRHQHSRMHHTTKAYSDISTPSPVTQETKSKIPTLTTKAPFSFSTKNDIDPSKCLCENKISITDERDMAKEEKRRIKEDRLRKKIRKQRRKDQLEKECGSERMNCFHHDNDHWKTAPLWTQGPFCFCMNANNNTYSCVRTINATHNFLYCEFTTGLTTFYNLRRDPFELQNRIEQLKPEERSFLHDQLKHLVACKGKSCTINHHHHQQKPRYNALPLPSTVQRPRKKKSEDFGHGINGRHGNILLAKIDTKGRGKNSSMIMNMRGLFRETGTNKKRSKT